MVPLGRCEPRSMNLYEPGFISGTRSNQKIEWQTGQFATCSFGYPWEKNGHPFLGWLTFKKKGPLPKRITMKQPTGQLGEATPTISRAPGPWRAEPPSAPGRCHVRVKGEHKNGRFLVSKRTLKKTHTHTNSTCFCS